MKNLLKRTGLNTKELSVIGFLLITFAAGLVIKYSGLKTPNEYDYSQTDKNFESRLKSSFEELKQTDSSRDSSALIRAEEIKSLADSLGIVIEQNEKNKRSLKPGTKININTSLAAELEMLPGIGKVMAERIVEYRETHGLFGSVNEIKRVPGIGEKKFADIKDFIVTE